MNRPQRVTFTVDDQTIELEAGAIARQADGAVLVRQGQAAVLVTVVASREPRSGGDFLPLTVEYREKAAAAGRIPGSFLRREGRINDDEVLACRILDRSIRPLFPKGFFRDVQVQASVLSADVNHAEAPILALIGAAAALYISPLPWRGPLGALRVCQYQGKVLALPLPAQRKRAEVDLVVSASPDGLVMVEGGADEVADEQVLSVLLQAIAKVQTCFAAFEELKSKVGAPTMEYTAPEPSASGAALEQTIAGWDPEVFAAALSVSQKQKRAAALRQTIRDLVPEILAATPLEPTCDLDAAARRAKDLLHARANRWIRERVLQEQLRVDGRGPEDIRPIDCQVDWLGTPHGSAIFTRGETQALVTCTLASQRLEQSVETLAGMEARRFLLHYNFPSYSVGEVRPLRGPGRREIGHGALAQRALQPVLPSFSEFPYVIRVESDISESNGSSSMATTCGGCLALMDAGVPLRNMVAGIAMGLISDGENFVVLSDILGDEDHLGDMDFKVTGTDRGVTALQMDNKLGSLPESVLHQAMSQAAAGRRHILGCMQKALAAPRAEPKNQAPRATAVPIAVPSMSALIGPKGATIREIQESCQVEVQVDDSGIATIFAADGSRARRAVHRIRDLAGLVEEGRIYQAKIASVKNFGAFVRIFASAEGLVPKEEWDLSNEQDGLRQAREGQLVTVKVLGADDRGRLQLSRRQAEDALEEEIVNLPPA